MTTTGSGRVNLGQHESLFGRGVAASGVGSNFNNVANFEENNITLVNGAFTITDEATLNLISDGSAPNFVEHLIEHETINANGDVTSVKLDFSSECRG